MKDSTLRALMQEYERSELEKAVDIHTFLMGGDYGTPIKTSGTYGNIPTPNHRERLILTFQGKYIHAKVTRTTSQPSRSNGRGTITDFSPGSRRRMFDVFHKLEIARRCTFLTLTYGDDYPDAKTAKNNLRAFLERIRRKFPDSNISAIWRLEFQERGAPHFHLVFFNLPFIDKRLIQIWWTQITFVPWVFTRIESINSHKKLMNYISKYVAKVNPDEEPGLDGFNPPTYLHAYRLKHGDDIGRVWGYFNKPSIPFAPCNQFEVPMVWSKFFALRDLAIKVFPPIADYLSLSFRVYVKSIKPYLMWFLKVFREEVRIMRLYQLENPALMTF